MVEGVAGRGCQKQSLLKETGSLSYGGFSFFFNVILFIFGCADLVAVQVFLSAAAHGFLIVGLLLLRSMGSRAGGLVQP